MFLVLVGLFWSGGNFAQRSLMKTSLAETWVISNAESQRSAGPDRLAFILGNTERFWASPASFRGNAVYGPGAPWWSTADDAISYTGTTYSQNFDSLASSGSGVAWTNDTTIPGWFLYAQPAPGTAITTYNADNGSSSAGNFYSFGSTGSSERALGGIGTGGSYFGSPASGSIAGWIAFSATNDTGSTINDVTIAFDGEQWRKSGDTVAQSMILENGCSLDSTGR